MLCSALTHDSNLTLFMTGGVTDVQMFTPSHPSISQTEMRSASKDAGQWNSAKTYSKPFIPSCWNNNVSRALESPCLNIWKNMCTSSTWLATFQHRRLHHLTSSKQLRGFIIWQATAVTQASKMKSDFFYFFRGDGCVLDDRWYEWGGNSFTYFAHVMVGWIARHVKEGVAGEVQQSKWILFYSSGVQCMCLQWIKEIAGLFVYLIQTIHKDSNIQIQ